MESKKIYEFIEANFAEDVKQALQEADKETRDNNVAAVSDKIATAYAEKFGEEAAEEHKADIGEAIYKLEKSPCYTLYICNGK